MQPQRPDDHERNQERHQDLPDRTKSLPVPDGVGNGAASFSNPLPGTDETWSNCSFGAPDTWPEALQAYALTISSFPYPACIFWGEEFVLFHNKEWTNAGGITDQQGTGQRGQLSADAFTGITAALHGGAPKRISGRALMRPEHADKADDYTVLISPLFDNENHERNEIATGTLAQMLPSGNAAPQKRNKSQGSVFGRPDLSASEGKSGSRENLEPDISQLGKVVDKVPLYVDFCGLACDAWPDCQLMSDSRDEHPFFHRFAEMLPTGLAILDHKAEAVFVNQHFYQLTTHQGDDKKFKAWPQSIHDDDYQRVMNAYHEAFTSQKQLRTEFRSVGTDRPWRLLLLTPLGDENLQHVSLREYGGFICSVVDITSEKGAELSERQAAQEARERRQQQERFIDMISHEIRNPLSAVLHCAEDIMEAVGDPDKVDIPSIKEAVDTINICIQHQRNIVDDVLSFSKLDASMLSLTPRACRPSRQLANSLKMFQPEFRKQSIKFGYRIDRSYVDYNVSWVLADLARVSQILVNLVSNAIKFTAKGTGEKRVLVSCGTSLNRPTSYPPNVVYFSSEDRAYRMDATNTKDWVSEESLPSVAEMQWDSKPEIAQGDGEPIYIMVAVKDTGIGISDEGQRRLFERFRQDTPKTEEIYGGSGLGLNISRKLCHLHGGEIGVSSKEGEGSTFGFFFKVRRAEKPEDYEGRAEDEQATEQWLQEEVRNMGNVTPEKMDSKTMPESLKHPPVVETEEASPGPSGQQDSKYLETAAVAAQVPEESSKSLERSNQSQQDGPRDTKSSGANKERNSQGGEAGEQATNQKTEKKKPHVLLVEDNVINQRIVSRKLASKGFRVTTANNGQEAVSTIKEAPKGSSGDEAAFDVILMDQEMPIMDGNTASKTIRELEKKHELEHIPILGVTANVRGAQLDEMLAAGMNEVISKPYKIDEMVQKIHKVIGAGDR